MASQIGYPEAKSDKSWLRLFFCWLFGGFLGLHRYYAGRNVSGFLYTITVGFLFLGWVFDLFPILFDSFTDGEGRKIIGTKRRRVVCQT